MDASGTTDLSRPTENRRFRLHWRPPPPKRRSPALGGTSNRAEFVSNSKIIDTPNHPRPTTSVRALCLDIEADGRRIFGRLAAVEHNVRGAAEVAP
jgi:hypothetical protein